MVKNHRTCPFCKEYMLKSDFKVHLAKYCPKRHKSKCEECGEEMTSSKLSSHKKIRHNHKSSASPSKSEKSMADSLKTQIKKDEKILQMELARLQIQLHTVNLTR